jgi:hypothetical protein
LSVAPRVANGVDKKFISECRRRVFVEPSKEFHSCQHTAEFVPVNAGKDSHAEKALEFPQSGEEKPGKQTFFAARIGIPEMSGKEAI